MGAVCALLMVILYFQDRKNTGLALENGMMKVRIETMQSQIDGKGSVVPTEPLSVDGIEEAVRHAGYVPDRKEGWILFMVAGEPFFIETGRLPSVFVIRDYDVDTKEWEMDLLKHAAHLMADELIMVKAIFIEDEESTGLRFLVGALDANNASFQENLTKYLTLISDANRRMHEIYDQLVKDKQDSALSLSPCLPAPKSENKVLS